MKVRLATALRAPVRALRFAAIAVALASVSLSLSAPVALASHAQTSIFQDDQLLLYSGTQTVTKTLATLKSLGVQMIRVTVKWSALAPDPLSYTYPGPYFDPRYPTSYPAANWAPYDRVISIAQRDGLAVNLDVTAPGPLWAMGRKPLDTRAADHWFPNVQQWEEFFYAVALRYDGQYYRFPHVTSWSIWNEPNQPGWLSPQSQKVNGTWTAVSPKLYRRYVDAAFTALAIADHGINGNQLLIGELAPEGDETPNEYLPMTPLPFLRDMYCVNGRYRPLSGTPATALGCPATPDPAKFVSANPGLFEATGFAHHPYYFFHPPNASDPDRNTVPIDDIGRLERALDSVYRAYGVHGQLPIYYTEYGYQTRPPNPFQTVTPAEQAAYLNQADFMAYNTPRVKSVAQFLLVDSAPDKAFPKTSFEYWAESFQTGLEFVNHKPKPAYTAYRMPIWIPHPSFHRGTSMLVWGQVRPASSVASTTAQVEFSGGAGNTWTTLGTVSTAQDGYFTIDVKPSGSGLVRIAWQSPHGPVYSRSVTVTAS
jgi:hypothetical protein